MYNSSSINYYRYISTFRSYIVLDIMSIMNKRYPSKVLLFGEYTVIAEGEALAIPFGDKSGHWCLTSTDTVTAQQSQKSLAMIHQHILQKGCAPLNLEQFAQDLAAGLWFDSNIPTGYGLGSSGAVCAAIYDTYTLSKASDLSKLKAELAQLENCFHGASSGIDPLVAYLQEALLVDSNQQIQPVKMNIPTGKGAIFLLDTQIPRQSTPLINFFVESSTQETFQKNYIEPAKEAAKTAIDYLVGSTPTGLLEATKKLSILQLTYLPPMVPTAVQSIWNKGLDTADFFLKICGAGGGGFLLGVTPDWEKTKKNYLSEYQTTVLYELDIK